MASSSSPCVGAEEEDRGDRGTARRTDTRREHSESAQKKSSVQIGRGGITEGKRGKTDKRIDTDPARMAAGPTSTTRVFGLLGIGLEVGEERWSIG